MEVFVLYLTEGGVERRGFLRKKVMSLSVTSIANNSAEKHT